MNKPVRPSCGQRLSNLLRTIAAALLLMATAFVTTQAAAQPPSAPTLTGAEQWGDGHFDGTDV
jgi:hypothetical protein